MGIFYPRGFDLRSGTIIIGIVSVVSYQYFKLFNTFSSFFLLSIRITNDNDWKKKKNCFLDFITTHCNKKFYCRRIFWKCLWKEGTSTDVGYFSIWELSFAFCKWRWQSRDDYWQGNNILSFLFYSPCTNLLYWHYWLYCFSISVSFYFYNFPMGLYCRKYICNYLSSIFLFFNFNYMKKEKIYYLITEKNIFRKINAAL